MTAEELARKLHESFGRVTPIFYGYGEGDPTPWESLPEKSREHLIAVCADVLGEKVEAGPLEGVTNEPRVFTPVPSAEEFEAARAVAVEDEPESLSDWYDDLQRQVDHASRSIRNAQKPFDGIVR